MKIGILVFLGLMMGFTHNAKADEEISCATDDQCQRDKVEAGYKEWQHKKSKQKAGRNEKAADKKDDYVPCAGDDDCQRSKLDAIDHGNGENVDD